MYIRVDINVVRLTLNFEYHSEYGNSELCEASKVKQFFRDDGVSAVLNVSIEYVADILST